MKNVRVPADVGRARTSYSAPAGARCKSRAAVSVFAINPFLTCSSDAGGRPRVPHSLSSDGRTMSWRTMSAPHVIEPQQRRRTAWDGDPRCLVDGGATASFRLIRVAALLSAVDLPKWDEPLHGWVWPAHHASA